MNRESWIYYWLHEIKDGIDLCKFRAAWRKMNQHNGTIPGGYFHQVEFKLER